MPELELGQAADEGPEFVVILGGKAGSAGVAILQTLILCKRWVEFGCQEGQEEIEEIYAESVGDLMLDVKSAVDSCCHPVAFSSFIFG